MNEIEMIKLIRVLEMESRLEKVAQVSSLRIVRIFKVPNKTKEGYKKA
jgi:hypothetical protein